MPYTNNPYCTVQQVYSALDLSTEAQSVDGDWITNDLIPAAQAMIDAYLGFSFQTDGTAQSPATRTFEVECSNVLYIPERCVSFSSVVAETGEDITADCSLRPFNESPGWYLKHKTGVFDGIYTVSGVFGRPSIPYPISRACVRTAVSWYKMRDSNYSDFIIEGMVRQHYQRDLPVDIVQILDQYKPRRFRV